MSLFVGIDGGGTKTICIAADQNLQILARFESTASNPLSVGFDKSSTVLLDLMARVLEIGKPDYAVLSIAGAGRKNHSDSLKEKIIRTAKKKKIDLPDFEIISDAEAALEGAHNGKPGIIFISGTGSIALAKDATGKIYRCGGYGRILGDAGSGYSISKEAFLVAAKYFDGRLKKTLLLELLSRAGITDRDELISKIYSPGFELSQFTPLVLLAAQKGDRAALSIIENEIKEVVKIISTIKKKAGLTNGPLALAGSLAAGKNLFSSLLKQKIKSTLPHLSIRKAAHTPEMGAIIMAKKNFHSL